MSLGIKSCWRARACAQSATLSSVPQGPLSLLACKWPITSHDLTRRASFSAETGIIKVAAVQPTKASSPSRRALFRRIVSRESRLGPPQEALVKPALQLPSKYETKRSLERHTQSAARQRIWASRNAAQGRPIPDWRTILDFMSKYTPRFGSIFEFKVVVGSGMANPLLSELDTNVLQIGQRTQCVIRVDEIDNECGTLTLVVSGFEDVVRRGLLEIVKSVGQVTAAKVMESDWKDMLHDSGRDSSPELVKLLSPNPTAVPDESMTLRNSGDITQDLLPEPRTYPYYMLTRRADDIVPPSTWTKASFEAHVAALVRGIVPRHLMGSLYKTGPDHRQHVLSLLVNLFSSEETRSSQSAQALGLALDYIQSQGPAFRSTARTIFDLAAQHNVAIDTRTYNALLRGAVTSGDIDGFNNIVRLMVKNGCYPDSKTWLSLLRILEDVKAKQLVVRKMRQKGLVRIQSTLASVGTHMAPYSLPTGKPMLDFIRLQDKLYGPMWLQIHGFNRMLDVLGSHRNFGGCKELLDFAHSSGRVRPDTVSMNTIITHYRNIRQMLDIVQQMRRQWSIPLDEVTYDILFQRAWKRRRINMLRVIWRYASFNRRTTSHMRHKMSKLLQKQDGFGQDILLKTWESEIFGDILKALKEAPTQKLDSVVVAKWYGAQALVWQPSVAFWDKLSEAYVLDKKIFAQMRQGEIITPGVRESLTVKIPLEPRKFELGRLLPAPESH